MSNSFAARHWYRFTVVSALLWPISLIFRALVWLRRLLYRLGVFGSVKLRVPVIVIGNLTVGGTGKTPLTLALARALRERGRPGIVCRGYGGRLNAPARVEPDGDPTIFGDEAVLLASASGVPVWAGVDRAGAANQLLAAHPEVDVLLCDDGLQHYRMSRDIEIAVEDARGAGNGLMLPAGPLREPATRHVEARVMNAQGSVPAGAYRMSLKSQGFYRLNEPAAMLDAATFKGKRLHAVAGIGNPERFFQSLREMELAPVTHAFPDHHAFTSEDLNFTHCDAVLMTEKDAIKCRRFQRGDLFALRVEACPDPDLLTFLEKRLHGLKAS